MKLLDRYLIGTVLKYVLLVMAVLLTLGGLLVFLGQQDDIGIGTYGVTDALMVTALELPQQAFELLPIGALLGALVGLGSLARGSELVVLRASGVSVWRIALSVAAAGAAVAAAMWVLGDYAAPQFDRRGRELKAFAKFADLELSGSGSAWVRDGSRFISIGQQSADNVFGGLYIYSFSQDGELESIGRAETAQLAPDATWRLGSLAETRFASDRTVARRVPDESLRTNVDAGFLGLAVTDPDSLTLGGLRSYIAYLERNSLDTRRYETAYWSRLARFAAAIVLACLAVPFAFGPLRSSGAGSRTVAGILIGVTYFLITRTLESSGEVFRLSPLLVAGLPLAVLTAITMIAIARTR